MLQRARRALRVARAVYRDAGVDFRYAPEDRFRGEFAELKHFMRKAFQVLSYNRVPGDYAEFGVWGARTFSLAYNASQLIGFQGRMWAFDSFEGLPPTPDPRDDHRSWDAGQMSMSEDRFRAMSASRGVPPDAYTTVVGFFSDTLKPDAAGARPERVSFAYVDCDLYTSTIDVLRFLETRIVNGSVIAFDDWYCAGAEGPSGERAAAMEVFDQSPRWVLVPFVQYGWHGNSFLVERR